MNPVEDDLPVVSVYMPTKNRRVLLQRAIESVYVQTYTNIELIICDDGSSDDTPAYLNSLQTNGVVKHIKVLTNPISKGACNARNQAIKSARGFFITGLDDKKSLIRRFTTYLRLRCNNDFAMLLLVLVRWVGKKLR